MKTLVTGGAGYIGSHTLVQLLESGHEALVVDSLVNGHASAIAQVEQLTNKHVPLEVGDIRDGAFLERIFKEFTPDAVIHFAGLKAVDESVENPLSYYDVNVTGSLVLLAAMQAHGCTKIVFSSSATVYGEPHYLPCDEAHPVAPVNPYGWTKLFVEKVLEDWCATQPERKALSLRYFNPVGAHASGMIGEHPRGTPSNLMPYIAQVAIGRRPTLKIFGDDYDTRDGTGERDYVHVVDLAKAHVLALGALDTQSGHDVINIGTGHGVTVKEMVDAFEDACGKSIRTTSTPRRLGDVASSFADCQRACKRLGWQPELGLSDMCTDTWHWHLRNPKGFDQI